MKSESSESKPEVTGWVDDLNKMEQYHKKKKLPKERIRKPKN